MRALMYSKMVMHTGEYPKQTPEEKAEAMFNKGVSPHYIQHCTELQFWKLYCYEESILARADNATCCHFVTFPMEALTPFWDYHGCCIRTCLPLRLVCFQEDPFVPPQEDLEWGVHTGVDPRPQANFLNGYKWGAVRTDQLIRCHRQDRGQHR